MPQLSSTKRQWLGANFRILGIGKLARLLEFDGKAVPTWDPLRYRTFGRIEEGWVGVPTPEVNERLGPGSLVVVVKPVNLRRSVSMISARRSWALGSWERVSTSSLHRTTPAHPSRTYRLRQRYCL